MLCILFFVIDSHIVYRKTLICIDTQAIKNIARIRRIIMFSDLYELSGSAAKLMLFIQYAFTTLLSYYLVRFSSMPVLTPTNIS